MFFPVYAVDTGSGINAQFMPDRGEEQHTEEWEFCCNSCLARVVCHPRTPTPRDLAPQVLARLVISSAFTWLRCAIGYAEVNRSSFSYAPETAIGLSQKVEWTRMQRMPMPPHGKHTKKQA